MRANVDGDAAKEVKEEKSESEGPGFPVGATLVARWMGKTERTCVVIERTALSNDRFKYYVHWHDFNRRMDEWINEHEIVRRGTDEETLKLQEKDAKEKEKEQRAKSRSSSNSKAAGSDRKDSTGADALARTRGQKRKTPDDQEFAPPEEEHDEHEGMDAASIREHEEVTKVKNVRFVEMGRFRMAAWYFSPFPKEYFPDGSIDCLHFCEFCMAFFCHKRELAVHQERRVCNRHPPGNEIYRHENLSVFEVDGAISKIYCQNLCYLAKLFLDHKTLYYDVDPFLFYVICEVDSRGFHPVGYFSKEKYSELGYNLACILTFPCHQRKGYGHFIIQFSYELSKKEEKVGSPEKPLSDLGLVSYRSYWTRELLRILKEYPEKEVSIMELTRMTSIKNEDIIATLQHLNMIKYLGGQYVYVVPNQIVDAHLTKLTKKGPQVVPEKLHWAPLHLDIKRDKWSLKAMTADKED
ncbi:putative MYST-like histone acetyltransferase 1 [Phytophthora fragariae]|uniref:histone acetyltransferase n=2 Tax=Phytophthora TaxID=4783 RepID=A0A6A4AD48_9STRA|nr:putative MYST-like histone acetyltransferase 1 [Phytophthora fragariae]KAE9134704.1 putative MYST-like histone acetyltransferase 1 [Phytophthora fragariae]KAE9153445.1 putative MYST-like histone acetyltransferase 1 [Phytophthora fragariae]KAE9253636.1 putative MYST-like histone acetyltransferase 1 [Phytophthora fragariae]KAE9326298.1 putative MYST-like histone acetyltransferase 1 [Phytophthora fragariae]